MANERHEPTEPRGGTSYQEARIPVQSVHRDDGFLPASIRRVSWGAIFGGAVVALVVQLALNLLGLAIGLGAIDPATETNPLSGLGLGAGIWLALSTVVALFIGGWAAGRLAGLPRRKDGLLHGVIAWAVVTLFTFYMVASGVGAVLGGAMNIVQQGAQLLGQGISEVAPAAAGALGEQVEGEVSVAQLEDEVREILRQSGEETLQPENLAERARQAAETAQAAAAEAATSPEDAAQEIEDALGNLIQQGRQVVREVDREATVNVLVARTDMSREEAQRTVQQYEDAIAQARQQLAETAQNIGQQATLTMDEVIATMSSAAFWAFLAMVIGAAAAAAGGAVGVPVDMPATPAIRRE